MTWEWLSDANEKFATGDVVNVMVKKISGDSVEAMKVEVSAREAKANVNKENLMRLKKQGKYVGKVTDVYRGTFFLCLNCRVNAVAHSCYDYRTPGKKDDVSFAVTRMDEERGVAVGIITRIIRQNL